MPAKGKKKKTGRKVAKEKPSSMHDRSRLLGQGNETLRLGQTSDHATEKHRPQEFIVSLRKKGVLDSIRISVRDVGYVLLQPPPCHPHPALCTCLARAAALFRDRFVVLKVLSIRVAQSIHVFWKEKKGSCACPFSNPRPTSPRPTSTYAATFSMITRLLAPVRRD